MCTREVETLKPLHPQITDNFVNFPMIRLAIARAISFQPASTTALRLLALQRCLATKFIEANTHLREGLDFLVLLRKA